MATDDLDAFVSYATADRSVADFRIENVKPSEDLGY
jgi:hypothetical protein